MGLAIILLIVALIAGGLGFFSAILGGLAWIAKVIFIICLFGALVSFFFGRKKG